MFTKLDERSEEGASKNSIDRRIFPFYARSFIFRLFVSSTSGLSNDPERAGE